MNNLAYHGILLVDKPPKWTSHDLVLFIRKFKIGKTGHAGTLDPMATGLMIILVGQATRLASSMLHYDKVYEGCMTLGIKTDTQDAMGKVLESRLYSSISLPTVQSLIANHFTGDIFQTPPMVSAIKHQGRPLYQLARQGCEVPRQPRRICIYSWEITEFAPPKITFRIHCSKGTYIRTLCADLGDYLGCGAHLSQLRRIQIGPFSINQAVSWEVLKKSTRETIQEYLIPLEKLVEGKQS